VKIHAGVVKEYAVAMKEQLAEGGVRFPAIVLFANDQNYWLADGFHRVLAARQAGLTEFAAEVRAGTRRDALLYSVSANTAHGLPRTNADKRKAVGLLLADGEWSQWSDREVARRCQVDNKVVARLRHRAGTVYEMNIAVRDAAEHPQAAETRPVDGAGIPVPDSQKTAFASLPKFQEAKDLFDRLAKALDGVARSPGGALYRQDLIQTIKDGQVFFACPGLRLSLAKLVAAEPYCCNCPTCHESHAGRVRPACKTCGGRGWTSRPAFETCRQAARDQLARDLVPGRK
jgi:hypothetical protein